MNYYLIRDLEHARAMFLEAAEGRGCDKPDSCSSSLFCYLCFCIRQVTDASLISKIKCKTRIVTPSTRLSISMI